MQQSPGRPPVSDSSLAFAAEEVAAILRHMNSDHPEDGLMMCQALGGQPAATAATATGVDKAGIDFEAMVDGSAVAVRLPWARTLEARAEVRGEVVRLYQEACASLGVAPREAEARPH